MQKLIAVSALLFSSLVYAHSQTPMSIKTLTYEPYVIAKIQIGNLRNVKQSFDIYIDDVKTNQVIPLQSGKTRKINVKIKNIIPDKKQVFEVCSVSKPLENDMFRSRICTDVKVYYPLSRLQHHYQQ